MGKRNVVHDEYKVAADLLHARRVSYGMSRTEAATMLGYRSVSEIYLIEAAKIAVPKTRIFCFKLAYELTEDEVYMLVKTYHPWILRACTEVKNMPGNEEVSEDQILREVIFYYFRDKVRIHPDLLESSRTVLAS